MSDFTSSTSKKYTIRIPSGETYELTENEVKLCELFNVMIGENDNEEIPIMREDCDKETFDKIVVFLNHYVNEPMNKVPKPVPQNSKIGDIVQPFYVDYIFGESTETTPEQEKILCSLINVSNYLEINSLLSLCCLKITVMIRNADRQKLAEMFGEDSNSESTSSSAAASGGAGAGAGSTSEI